VVRSSSSLVVGWNEDAGRLGPKVIEYLVRRLGGQEVAEIEPEGYFSLGGVSVENDIAQFPECKLHYCREKGLAFCRSDPPRANWHRFLHSILDVAEACCNAQELYTFGAMISFGPHTAPRELIAVASSPEARALLGSYGLSTEIDYETPPGQRPTLNSFLLWVAQRRGMSGASLWVPIPFYLVGTDDPRAWKRVVEFLDVRFDLGLDLGDLDEEVAGQDEVISQIRDRYPDMDNSIRKLENNLALSQEESEALAKGMEELLRKRELS